jgi:hypothetical protein
MEKISNTFSFIADYLVIALYFKQKKARLSPSFIDLALNYNKLDRIVFNVSLGRIALAAKSASAK